MFGLIHIAFSLIVFFLISYLGLISTGYLDLFFLLCAELIDLDHLLTKPIYKPKRNSFKSHFLHKRWYFVLIFGVILLFIRPVLFLGMGLIFHLMLDYVYVRVNKI